MLDNPSINDTECSGSDRIRELCAELRRGVMVADGAMGSELKRITGTKGCTDMLCVTMPRAVESLHLRYAEAGAVILTTNTVCADPLTLSQYGSERLCVEINRAGAELARSAAAAMQRPVWVAGSVGPTGWMLSRKPDGINADVMEEAYFIQMKALLDGGADFIYMETVTDPANAACGMKALRRLSDESGRCIPFGVSFTPAGGARLVSGASCGELVDVVAHANPIMAGVNCSDSAADIEQSLACLKSMRCPLSCMPSFSPGHSKETLDMLMSLRSAGMIEVAGACCGSTPADIRAIASLV